MGGVSGIRPRPWRWAPTAQSAGPQRGLALRVAVSVLKRGLAGPLPHPGEEKESERGWEGGRERERERLLKFLSGEINIEAISEQVFQLWAWHPSPIPVKGTDSFLIHLCHPPQHSRESVKIYPVQCGPQDGTLPQAKGAGRSEWAGYLPLQYQGGQCPARRSTTLHPTLPPPRSQGRWMLTPLSHCARLAPA